MAPGRRTSSGKRCEAKPASVIDCRYTTAYRGGLRTGNINCVKTAWWLDDKPAWLTPRPGTGDHAVWRRSAASWRLRRQLIVVAMCSGTAGVVCGVVSGWRDGEPGRVWDALAVLAAGAILLSLPRWRVWWPMGWPVVVPLVAVAAFYALVNGLLLLGLG